MKNQHIPLKHVQQTAIDSELQAAKDFFLLHAQSGEATIKVKTLTLYTNTQSGAFLKQNKIKLEGWVVAEHNARVPAIQGIHEFLAVATMSDGSELSFAFGVDKLTLTRTNFNITPHKR